MFNPDTWKQQWAALMSAPYIIFPLLVVVAGAVWWIRGWQIKVFKDRLQLASERVAWANEVRDEAVRAANFERQFKELKAEIVADAGNSALAESLAKVTAAV